MKLCVLALDYDGTTAINDKMDPGIRRVIADARSRRIAVVLVTGRRLRRKRCRRERDPAAVPAIASAIRGRYDFTSDEAIPCAEEER